MSDYEEIKKMTPVKVIDVENEEHFITTLSNLVDNVLDELGPTLTKAFIIGVAIKVASQTKKILEEKGRLPNNIDEFIGEAGEGEDFELVAGVLVERSWDLIVKIVDNLKN